MRTRGLAARLRRALPYLGIAFGMAVLLYFPVSEGIDAMRRQEVADRLDSSASVMDGSAVDGLITQARAYNAVLAGEDPSIDPSDVLPYAEQLSPDGRDTAFGYVLIPKINLVMPVYHGTSDAVLSAGVGHLQGTSLPVGGSSTHTVLTAHSGMEQMRAFDDIRLLEKGDVFGIRVLGRLVTYEVTGSEVVLPDDVSSLAIRRGEDLATLVTCTPYGVNDHRLLVHARRCPVPPGFDAKASEISPLSATASPRALPALIAALALAASVGVGRAVGSGLGRRPGGRMG